MQTSARLRRAGGAPSGAAGLDEDDEDEDEEFDELEASPLPGTRAQAVPYTSPPGTRAALMMEKGKGKARETSLRRR